MKVEESTVNSKFVFFLSFLYYAEPYQQIAYLDFPKWFKNYYYKELKTTHYDMETFGYCYNRTIIQDKTFIKLTMKGKDFYEKHLKTQEIYDNYLNKCEELKNNYQKYLESKI